MENRITPPERYTSERLMAYRLAVATVENMVNKGVISLADSRIMLDALADKYGFEKGSIYAI